MIHLHYHPSIKDQQTLVQKMINNMLFAYIIACTSSNYYNALTTSYYCFYFYSTNKVARIVADSHCQSNGDSLPHVDSFATWTFLTTAFPSPPV